MRITVTLEADVASLLCERRKATGKGLEATVNEALRDALVRPALNARPRPRRAFRTFSVGALLSEDLDDVSGILDRLKGDRRTDDPDR